MDDSEDDVGIIYSMAGFARPQPRPPARPILGYATRANPIIIDDTDADDTDDDGVSITNPADGNAKIAATTEPEDDNDDFAVKGHSKFDAKNSSMAPAKKKSKTTPVLDTNWMQILKNKYGFLPRDIDSTPIPRRQPPLRPLPSRQPTQRTQRRKGKTRWGPRCGGPRLSRLKDEWKVPILITPDDASLFRNTELYDYSASNIVLIFEVSSMSPKTLNDLGQVKDDEGKLDVTRWKKRAIFNIHAFFGPPPMCEQGYLAVAASECHYEARLSVLFETLVGSNTNLILYPNDSNYQSNFASVINDQNYLQLYTKILRWSGHQLIINNNHSSTKTSTVSRQAGEPNSVADFGLCSFHNSGRPDDDAGGNKILDHLPQKKRSFWCNQDCHSHD